jgi:hypothetical protein
MIVYENEGTRIEHRRCGCDEKEEVLTVQRDGRVSDAPTAEDQPTACMSATIFICKHHLLTI